MHITITYNERTEHNEEQGELIPREDIDAYCQAVSTLGHDVEPLEVTGSTDHVIDLLKQSDPELVLNLAEGLEGRDREAVYPLIYDNLGIPFTGSDSAMLHLCLDKRLTERVVERHGVNVPRGKLVTPDDRSLPPDLDFPLLVKPNYEGSSKGISQDSICRTPEHAEVQIDRILQAYPLGANVEQYIDGLDVTVPLLEDWPGRFLEPVVHTFNGGHDLVYDFELKHRKVPGVEVGVDCPPRLSSDRRDAVDRASRKVLEALPMRDLGRIDFRLDDNGKVWFLEVNPLPRVAIDASLGVSMQQAGLKYPEMFERIINSAARRFGLNN